MTKRTVTLDNLFFQIWHWHKYSDADFQIGIGYVFSLCNDRSVQMPTICFDHSEMIWLLLDGESELEHKKD